MLRTKTLNMFWWRNDLIIILLETKNSTLYIHVVNTMNRFLISKNYRLHLNIYQIGIIMSDTQQTIIDPWNCGSRNAHLDTQPSMSAAFVRLKIDSINLWCGVLFHLIQCASRIVSSVWLEFDTHTSNLVESFKHCNLFKWIVHFTFSIVYFVQISATQH